MSSVNSENFTCSEHDPTINTSCNASVIIGDFSKGGVINGFSLWPFEKSKLRYVFKVVIIQIVK